MAFPTPQEFKVVVVGEKSVGKTSLVLRFIDGCFQPQQQPTIGAFFFSKHLVLAGGAACVLQVWDTAGQERFRAITPMYYRQAMGAIVCFDVTSEASFETMQGWVKELRENTEPGSIVIAIAATKADLEAARVVDQEGPRLYAASIGALYAETSAKANVGVQDLFVTLGQVSSMTFPEARPALLKALVTCRRECSRSSCRSSEWRP